MFLAGKSWNTLSNMMGNHAILLLNCDIINIMFVFGAVNRFNALMPNGYVKLDPIYWNMQKIPIKITIIKYMENKDVQYESIYL